MSNARAALLGCITPLLLLGCGDADAWRSPLDVRAELAADITTVVRVSWRTDVATVGYVEYGPDPSMDFSTPLETKASLEHSQLLLGLEGDADYAFRVVTWDGREAGASAIQSARTGEIPRQLPHFAQTGASFEQLVVLPIRTPNPGVAILDGAGQVVWYYLDKSGLEPLRARLSADKGSVLYHVASVDEPSEASAIVRVALDGAEEQSIPVPFLGHDFLELADGTLAALTSEAGADGVRDDSIVEIDADGNASKVWSASDCFDLAQMPGDGSASAWAYANALDYADSAKPSERAYYVSLRNFSSIVKISPETRACEWVLGTTATTLEFAEDSRAFVHQSGLDAYGNRALVMDNGLPSEPSRVVEYEIDVTAGKATERQSYVEPTDANVGELGGTTRLVDGRWFVNWAGLGRLELVEDGAATWQVSADGALFGYHTLAESLYAADSRRP